MNKERGMIAVSKNYAIFLCFFLFFLFLIVPSRAVISETSGNATSTIWTAGTPNGNNLTYGTILGKSISYWNFYFYANYTNSTSANGSPINASNGNGLCKIAFNQTGAFSNLANMTYNASSLLWQFNTSLNYRGNLSFRTECNSTYGNISLADYFIVRNTVPWINKSLTDKLMTPISCMEDNVSSCTYNLSGAPYVFEDDLNDASNLVFIDIPANTTLGNYTLSSNGTLVINFTLMNQSTSQDLWFSVSDLASPPDSADLPVLITAVNDAPVFVNLQNRSMSINSPFAYNISASDEENNVPFTFNVSFVSCSVAQWSTRNCSNSTGLALFDFSYYINSTSNLNLTSFNISFTPGKNDVGNYTLNFTAIDLNNNLNPKNASTSQLINFSVLNINSAPYFRYSCNNENSTTEDVPFNCYINVSDTDETSSLNISANYSWLTFNNSLSSIVIPVNITTGFNATANVSFIPEVSNVGNWTINISAKDSSGLINSTLMRLFIKHTNHSVSLGNVSNFTAVSGTNTIISINASDNDLLIPDKSVYNENLTVTLNVSWMSLSSANVAGNITFFNFTASPSTSLIGMNAVNITVYDSNNYSLDSRIFYVNVTAGGGGDQGSNTGTGNTGTGGGGGGTTTILRPVSLKLLVPDPLILSESGIVILPITLQNDGVVSLSNITLNSSVVRNGNLISAGQVFSAGLVSVLYPNSSVLLNLTVLLDTGLDGLYEINVNANVQNPSYNQSAKAYVTVQGGQISGNQLAFAEQFILSNAACSNLSSMIEHAKSLYEQDNFTAAQEIIGNAIMGCRQAIEQSGASRAQAPASRVYQIFVYLIIAVIAAAIIGFFYYLYNQLKLNKIIGQSDF